MKTNIKSILLTTSAVCTMSFFANQAFANDEILDLLNTSATRSPNLTWTTEGATSDDISINGQYYKYTIADPLLRPRLTDRQTELSSNVTADFIGISSSDVSGGALYNEESGYINILTSNFVGNRIYSDTYSFIEGGAIYNAGIINKITGDFIGNYSYGMRANSGAIYNHGTIGSITGNFMGNHASVPGSNGSAYGGAIYNEYATI